MIVDIVAATLLVVGALLALTAAIGLHRFPDVFARMHAATKPATLGLALLLIGAAMKVPDLGSIAKLMLVLVLAFATAPVGSHLVGRAAYRAGTELAPDTQIDELAAADID